MPREKAYVISLSPELAHVLSHTDIATNSYFNLLSGNTDEQIAVLREWIQIKYRLRRELNNVATLK